MSEQDNRSRAAAAGGWYDAWYLTLTDRRSGAGYIVRATLRTPRAGPSEAGAWFAAFHPTDPDRTFGIHRYSADWSIGPGEFEFEGAGATFASGRAQGEISGAGREVAWNFEWPVGASTYASLPSTLQSARLSSAGVAVPNPDVAVSGWVVVDGEKSSVDGASGQQGHTYGRRQPERWAWAHCGDFRDEKAILEAVTAQGRVGRLVTPFLTTVGLMWDGRWIEFTGMGWRRDFTLGMWRLDVGSRRYRLTGRVEAPARDMVRGRYLDPDGTPRHCHNTEIASSRVTLFERRPGGFEEIAFLESVGTTHAEWAGRTPAAPVTREFVRVGEETGE